MLCVTMASGHAVCLCHCGCALGFCVVGLCHSVPDLCVLALSLRCLCDPVCLLCVLWTGHAWCAVSPPEPALYLCVGTCSHGASGIQIDRPHRRSQERGDSPYGDLALHLDQSLRGGRGHLFPALAPILASVQGGGGGGKEGQMKASISWWRGLPGPLCVPSHRPLDPLLLTQAPEFGRSGGADTQLRTPLSHIIRCHFHM